MSAIAQRAACITLLRLALISAAAWTPSQAASGQHNHLASTDEQLTYFSRVMSGVDASDAGSHCLTPECIILIFKSSFERTRRRGIIVDVGASTGETSTRIVELLGQPMLSYAGFDWRCHDLNRPLTLYAFEPNAGSFKLLRRNPRLMRARKSGAQIRFVEAAVSNVPGNRTIYHVGPGDSGSSFQRHCKGLSHCEQHASSVRVLTLDQYFGRKPRQIHLLKVDAEGYDPLVLQGAEKLFFQKRVKFVIFEYISLWATAEHKISLHSVVHRLHISGYLCFAMTIGALVPLSGHCWQSDYESFSYRNVLCGQQDDPDLFDAYVAYGTNYYTLAYALDNLQLHRPLVTNASWHDRRFLRL